MHHHDSWITFSIRHPFHQNLSETQAIVISYLLPTICVSYCKNEVRAFWVSLQLVIISFPFVCDDIPNAFSFEGLRLPEELQGYHTLVPIEPSGANVERRKLGNWLSVVYRAIRTSDGIPYALRRIESAYFQTMFPCLNTKKRCLKIIAWRNNRRLHLSRFGLKCNIQILLRYERHSRRALLVTTVCNATSSLLNQIIFFLLWHLALVVVYAYHPNAQTLYEAHIKPKVPAYQQPVYYGRHNKYQQAQHQILPERTLWSYIIQLASAIKKVHEKGQAVRMLDVTKILVTGQNRFVILFYLGIDFT